MSDREEVPGLLVRLAKASVSREGRRLLDGVSWQLEAGQHWAVLGENGAGKTTFLRLVRGDLAPDEPRSRTYSLDGEEQHSPLGLRERIGLVSTGLQDFYATSETEVTALEAVLAGFFDAPLLYGEPEPHQRERAEQTLAALGAADLAHEPMRILSRGQQRKVLLARALALSPDILILDEYLDGLDARSRAQVLELMDRAAEHAALLCAAHRAADLPACLTHALLLEGGRVKAAGPLAEVLPLLDTPRVPKPECPWSACPEADEEAVIFSIQAADVILDGRDVLRDIDWEVRAGENWAVLGENGAGKSTLLRLVLGELSPAAVHGPPGLVERFGDRGVGGALAVRTRMSVVSPALQASYGFDLPVREVVLSGFFGSIGLYDEPTPEQGRRADAALDFLGIADLGGRRLRSLSYGQQRKVFLARALAPGPDLLVLDEPFSGLDAASRRDVNALLERLARAGQRFLLVTHRAEEMIPAVNRVLVLESGRVAFSGTRAAFAARGR